MAVNNSMQNILGESETGNKPMLVSANSTNNYFAPVNDQVALSWDFRPPLVGANVQGNTESPLQTIETTEGVQDVPYSTIAVIVNSPHNDQTKSWWHPATLKMVLTPDPESPRKIYLSYKESATAECRGHHPRQHHRGGHASRQIHRYRPAAVPVQLRHEHHQGW